MRKKVHNFQLIIVLLIATGGHFSCNNENKPANIETTFFSPADSLFEPTGNAKLDSLMQLATVANPDTSLARLYYDIGGLFENLDRQKAKAYYLNLRALSEQLGWNEGLYLFAAGYASILIYEELMDSALVINQQVLELAKKEMNERWLPTILGNIGICYHEKQWYETALQYYNESLSLFEKSGLSFRIAHVSYIMSFLYDELNMKEESLKFCERALEILNEKPDTFLRANALNHYAIALSESNQFDIMENSLMEALRISTLNNNKVSLRSTYSNLGYLSLLKFDLENAEIYTRKALVINEEFGIAAGSSISYRVLSKVELIRKNFGKSEEYAEKALTLAIESDSPVQTIKCYKHLANLSTALHDFRNHQFYEAKADSIEVTLTIEKTRIYAKEMEAKYETEKKELKITALEEEKRLMTWLGITGGTVLLLTLTVFTFLWRWTVQKRRISEQQRQLAESRIRQLEQEKQLIATQSVLDGETRERSRLARDLHDGLGSMLTGVKLQLLEMKQGVKLEYVDEERFDKALGLLDNSVNEMRRVAHHLMPDSLSRFGLKPAVSDFCSNLPSVQFAYYGDELRLDPNLEVMIYRSIHELVNNALKHAGADRIIVQIMQEPDRIAFTVQDNGCGFDPAATHQGMGLQNIRTRVESYNGVIDIDSQAGGTEIHVEVRVG